MCAIAGPEYSPDAVRLIDDQTFETIHRHELDQDERCVALISTTLADDLETYYIVGTAYEYENDLEPSKVSGPQPVTRGFRRADYMHVAWSRFLVDC